MEPTTIIQDRKELQAQRRVRKVLLMTSIVLGFMAYPQPQLSLLFRSFNSRAGIISPHPGHSNLLSFLSITTSGRETETPPQPAHVLVEDG